MPNSNEGDGAYDSGILHKAPGALTIEHKPNNDLQLQASKLCSYCQLIADGWPPYDDAFEKEWIFKHYDCFAELRESADDGCTLCSQFLGEHNIRSDLHTGPKEGSVLITSLSPEHAIAQGIGNHWQVCLHPWH